MTSNELDTLFHLGIIVSYILQLLEKEKIVIEWLHSGEILKADKCRDIESQPEVLLPFRRTQIKPESQIEKFCVKMRLQWVKSTYFARSGMLMPFILLCVLQSTLIFTRVLSVLISSESIMAILLKKISMTTIVIIVIHYQEKLVRHTT